MDNSLNKQFAPGGDFFICIRHADDDGQIWDVDLSADVIIGREENCHIRLSEKSVSRQHCRIYKDGIPMIENLSKTNITKVNNSLLNDPAPLNEGDRLACGRITLLVDSIYSSDTGDDESLHSGTVYINV